jgi:hypothetical protein
MSHSQCLVIKLKISVINPIFFQSLLQQSRVKDTILCDYSEISGFIIEFIFQFHYQRWGKIPNQIVDGGKTKFIGDISSLI